MLFSCAFAAALTALASLTGANELHVRTMSVPQPDDAQFVALKGHIRGTTLASVTARFHGGGFSVKIKDNLGTVKFDDGRKVDVVVVYPGNEHIGVLDYDPTWGYNGAWTLAVGADEQGFLAMWYFDRFTPVPAASTANSNSSDQYNLNSDADNKRYERKYGSVPVTGLDLDVTVPLLPRTDQKCPTNVSADQAFTLADTCFGKVGDWEMTVFETITCVDCRQPLANYIELDALLVKGDAVCFAAIFVTEKGKGEQPITLVPVCIDGTWPAELNHWQLGSVSQLVKHHH